MMSVQCPAGDFLQLKAAFQVIERDDRVFLRNRTTSRILAIASAEVDVTQLVARLVEGVSERALLETWSSPRAAVAAKAIVDGLREKGAVLSLDGESGIPEAERAWFSRPINYFAELESKGVSRFQLFERVRRSHVVFVGAGSLGSWAMLALASAGVGRITVVDCDVVEATNLARQVAYAASDVGRFKVDAAVDAVRRLTPFVEVVPVRTEITSPEDLVELLGSGPKVDLVVLTADMPVWEISRVTARACRATGTPLLRGSSLGIGPLYVPSDPESACPGCDWPRLVDAEPNAERMVASYRDQFLNGGAAAGRRGALGTEIAVAGAVLGQEAILFLAGLEARCRTRAHRVVLDAFLSTTSEPFAKDARCTDCAAPGDQAAARDELAYGDVVRSSDVTIAPARDGFHVASVSIRHPRLPLAHGARVLGGHAYGFADEPLALRAFGEAVEHASAFYAGLDARSFVKASHVELVARGAAVVPFPALIRYVPGATPTAIAPLTRETPISWTTARRASTGERVLVPALLSYLRWRPPPGEALFAWPDATGLAAHRTMREALERAAFEVVERDATMLSWKVPGWPTRSVEPSALSERLARALENCGFTARLYDVGRLDGPSVIVALVARADGSELACGSSCRPDERSAAEHAVKEALMMRHAVLEARGSQGAPDLDGDREENHAPRTSLAHVARYFADGREVLGWYARQAEETQEATSYRPADLGDERLSRSLLYVDVSDARARASGWSVVRAFVLGSQPRESDALAPCHATRALGEALAVRSNGRRLHDVPHPFG